MSAQPEDRSAASKRAVDVPPPTARLKKDVMMFRIVGPHQHRAVVRGHVFLCTRETTTVNDVLSSHWLAFAGTTVLKSDCRTLNEAKKLCRAAAEARASD